MLLGLKQVIRAATLIASVFALPGYLDLYPTTRMYNSCFQLVPSIRYKTKRQWRKQW